MRPKSESDPVEPSQQEASGPRLMEPQPAATPAPERAPEPPVQQQAPASSQQESQAAAPSQPTPAAAPPPRVRGGRGMRLLLVLVLIVVAGGGYGGYWWTVLRGTVSTDDAYVEARIVSVASRLSERVAEVLVQEGDLVSKGQALARFADDRLRILVRQAQAEVNSAQALLEETRNAPRQEEVDVARAEVAVREADVELQVKEWARAQRLMRAKAISEQELSRRRGALSTAEGELEVSRRKLSLLLAGRPDEEIAQAEADLALARARLAKTRQDLQDTELPAPIAGIVAKKMVDPGEVVQNGQALFQIVEADKTWVVANLEEDQISEIAPGQPVRVWVDAYPGREFRGRVGPLYAATLSRFSLLPSSSASGTFIKVTQRVPVRIEWEETELPPVYPGLNVVVRITVQ